MANELASATFTTAEQRQELDQLEAWALTTESVSEWKVGNILACPLAWHFSETLGTQAVAGPGGISTHNGVCWHTTRVLSPALSAVMSRVDSQPAGKTLDRERFIEIVRQVRSLLG